jgi:sodium transport system permease protein
LHNIWTIFKKEWHRVIRDKRLVLSVMVLPGLMIFLIYTFIGSAMDNMFEGEMPQVALVNAPTPFTSFFEPLEETYETEAIAISLAEVDLYRDLVDNGEWDAIIIFPPNFEASVGADPRPQVYLYSNPNEPVSSTVASRFQGYLNIYQTALAEAVFGDTSAFTIQLQGQEVNPDLQSGLMLSMLLPMLTVMFMFSGAMSIGPESIAGEKERGTIATLLITPVKRREIALGKVLSLGVLSLLSAISSFLGIALSFNNLFPEGTVSFSAYGIQAMIQILLLLFSTVFVIVGIIAIISAYAKNLKEAGTLIMPVYILTILTGVTSMFNSGANQNLLLYLVPMYNTVQSLTAILLFDPITWSAIGVTVLSNVVFVAIFIAILNNMFQSEKIMFSK